MHRGRRPKDMRGTPSGGFWRWQWQRWRQGLPREPASGYRFAVAEPDLAFLGANRRWPTVTWIGHATLLFQLDGLNLLTDPQFSPRASPVPFLGPRRRVPPVPPLQSLPHIDVVLLSHNHYDHLDRASIRSLVQQPGGSPYFFTPHGMGRWFKRQGAGEVVEMDWWSEAPFRDLRLHCVPARHWSARTAFDRNRSLWCGWVVRGSFQILFIGDTGYSEQFREIHRQLGPMDLAAIPIGHYEPRWFMQASHVAPEEAVQIALDLHARRAIGIHWGTFPLTDEPLDEPPRRLRVALETAGLPADIFLVLARGETRRIDTLLSDSPVGSH